MNSYQRLAAKRYAAAYDALSHSREEAARRAEELAVVAGALAKTEKLLTNPSVALSYKKEAVRAALADMPQTAAFVEVLLEAKRYTLLPEIVRQVQERLDVRLGVVRAQVISAQILYAPQRKQTVQALEKRYGKKVEASFQTDASLLGGLKIWCNGELIDGSIQRQLLRLQEELMK